MAALCSLAPAAVGQRNVRSIKPTHRAALAKYLNTHKNCDFLSESVFEQIHGPGAIAYLKRHMAEHIQRPYYIVGDFNRDGREDFAMLLAARVAGKDKYRIVVWNGSKRGFRVAWEDTQDKDGIFYWSWETASNRRLVFGPPESDAGFFLTPAGGSYVPEGS